MARLRDAPEHRIDPGQQVPIVADVAPVALPQVEVAARVVATVEAGEGHDADLVAAVGAVVGELRLDHDRGLDATGLVVEPGILDEDPAFDGNRPGKIEAGGKRRRGPKKGRRGKRHEARDHDHRLSECAAVRP